MSAPPLPLAEAAGPAARLPVSSARSRFVVNVSANVGYMALNVAVMLWYVPFLIGHLGIAAYGVISLTNTLVTYSALLTASLETSTGRFLAIDLGAGDEPAARRTFNTALALCAAACAVLCLAATIVVAGLPFVFDVAQGLETESRVLFACFGLATAASLIGGTFGAPAVIMHRFELRSLVRALTLLSRVGVVAACFWLWPASLWGVAAGLAASAFVGLVGDVLIWRCLTPGLRLAREDVDRSRMRDLTTLGGWSAANQAGNLLLAGIDLLIVNMLFGVVMTGRYGSLLLFPALLQTLVETVALILSPIILGHYAVGDHESLQQVATRSARLLGMGLSVPVGLLCGFGAPLLSLWLGPDFRDLDILLVALVGHMALTLALRPLAYVITAYDRVRILALSTLVCGPASILLALALALWGGWGMVGVAAAGAACWCLRNVAFLSTYTARLMGMPWWTFLPGLAATALATLGVAAAGRIVAQAWPLHTWPLLLSAMTVTGLLAAALVAAFGLTPADRSFIRGVLKRSAHV